MTTKAHSLVSLAARHPVIKYSYANAAARTGATGFAATDLHTVAYQADTGTYWMLTATTPTWAQLPTGPAAGFTAASVIYADGSGGLTDDGANFSYAAGIVTLTNGVTFTGGGTIATTSNSNIDLVPDGTGITTIGGGAGSHLLNAPGDLYVSGELEIDGTTYFDTNVAVANNVGVFFGTINNNSSCIIQNSVANPDVGVIGAGSVSNVIMVTTTENRFESYGWTLQTNPTFVVHSANDDSVTDEWGSLAHDQTDFVIDSGTLTTKFTGGLKHNVTTVNAATYDLLASDYFVHVTYTGTGAVTSLTLPTAQTVSGRTIVIKDAGGNASVNNITVDTQASETIDGAATAVMNADYEWLKLYSDGSDWFIVGN